MNNKNIKIETGLAGSTIVQELVLLEEDIDRKHNNISYFIENHLGRWIVDTQDKEVIKALVSLGWTPPGKNKNKKEIKISWFFGNTGEYHVTLNNEKILYSTTNERDKDMFMAELRAKLLSQNIEVV